MFGSNVVGGVKTGLTLSKALGGISKALSVANQAIPIYQQVKPIFKNAKGTMDVVKNIFSSDDKKIDSENKKSAVTTLKTKKMENASNMRKEPHISNSPVFFQ